MDRFPSQHILHEIGSFAHAVEGVKEVLHTKARYVGAVLHVDLCIAVNEDISMREADVIAREVEGVLVNKFPNTKEVNVILA